MLLNLYNTASDEIRVAAFIGLRSLAIASDHALRESVIKVSDLFILTRISTHFVIFCI